MRKVKRKRLARVHANILVQLGRRVGIQLSQHNAVGGRDAAKTVRPQLDGRAGVGSGESKAARWATIGH